MMLEWSMLSSSAASCIVERGSALIIALSWSLSTSSSQLLCWSSNALATWCEELTHLEKTLMLGRIEGRRRRGRQRMRWHHWLDGHEFEQAPGVGDGQGSLVYCSPWGHKESDTTKGLSWTKVKEEGAAPPAVRSSLAPFPAGDETPTSLLVKFLLWFSS